MTETSHEAPTPERAPEADSDPQSFVVRFTLVRFLLFLVMVTAFLEAMAASESTSEPAFVAAQDGLSHWGATLVQGPEMGRGADLSPEAIPFGPWHFQRPIYLDVRYDPFASDVAPVGYARSGLWPKVLRTNCRRRSGFGNPQLESPNPSGPEKLAFTAAIKATKERHEAACSALEPLVDAARAMRDAKFVKELRLLDYAVAIDLRRWVFWLPLGYLLSVAYLMIIGAERRVLSARPTGARTDVTPLGDAGSSGGDGLPSRVLLLRVVWCAELVALGTLAVSVFSRQFYDFVEIQGVCGLIVCAAVYIFAFADAKRRAILRSAALENTGWYPRLADRSLRFANGVRKRIQRTTVGPRLTLGIVLVLSSLATPVACAGCNVATGIEVLVGRTSDAPLAKDEDPDHPDLWDGHDVRWVGAAAASQLPAPGHHALKEFDRALYAAAIVVALLSWLPLFARQRVFSVAAARALRSVGRSVLGALTIDAAFAGAYNFIPRLCSATWVEYVAIAGILWLDAKWRRTRSAEAAWNRAVLWAPIVLVALDALFCVTLAPHRKVTLFGLPIFAAGLVVVQGVIDESTDPLPSLDRRAAASRAWHRIARRAQPVFEAVRRRSESSWATKAVAIIALVVLSPCVRPQAPSESELVKACDSGDGASCSSLGLIWYDKKRSESGALAIDFDRRACAEKDPRGCANLGAMYATGEGGVTKDLAVAADYYRTACDAGEGHACLNFSKFLRSNVAATAGAEETAAPLRERAEELLRDACFKRRDWNCRALGELYGSDSEMAPQSPNLYEIACGSGDARGCLSAGKEYERGLWIHKDGSRARERYEAACDLGIGEGCKKAADAYRDGDNGVSQEKTEAAKLYTKACTLGSAEGCFSLGLLTEYGRSGMSDHAAALREYKLACEKGLADGCSAAARLYSSGDASCAPDELRAFEFTTRACGLATTRGRCGALAPFYRRGFGSADEALNYFAEGCSAEQKRDCYDLGMIYAAGRSGVAPDDIIARQAFEFACPDWSHGFADACLELARCQLNHPIGFWGEDGDALATFTHYCVVQQASPRACGEAARLLSVGNAAEPGRGRVVEFFAASCDGGYGPGCTGYAAEIAVGASASMPKTEAVVWRRRGCELGDTSACDAKSER